ncbi:MAG: hypothetical protein PHT33_08810 [bacterium]|nr:hypothetical protein [bacterium]
MSKKQILSLHIDNLLLNVSNYRYEPKVHQREALYAIAKDSRTKIANIAENILYKGLNPSEFPIITASDDPGMYIVLEGNRRIAAIKLLFSPTLVKSLGLPNSTTKKLVELHNKIEEESLSLIDCVLLPADEAKYWIGIKHTGENEGVGTVGWDGLQTHRFRGDSPAASVVELVRAHDYIDDEVRRRLPKIAVTNIERLLGTPEARELIGVKIERGELVLKEPKDEAVARLSMIVSDIALKNIKVTDLDTKEQRVKYAEDVAQRPLPEYFSKPEGEDPGKDKQSNTEKQDKQNKGGQKRNPTSRTTLIPRRGFSLTIQQTRINKIYEELQEHLKIRTCVNCCAVMFRVFLELSVDDFADRNKIDLTVLKNPKNPDPNVAKIRRDMTLKEKLKTIVAYLEEQGVNSKNELFGIKALLSNRFHVLSVDSLNAYVHNRNYSPTEDELKTTWDNLQPFIKRLWPDM